MMDIKRRQFLNAALGAGAATSLGGVTTLFPNLARAATHDFDDYKALVVLFLHGGNDAFNMVVPLADETLRSTGRGYQTYQSRRAGVAVNNVELGLVPPPDPDKGFADGKNRYLTPPSLTENLSTPGTPATDAVAYLKGVHGFGDFGINGVMPELAELFRRQQAAVVANIGSLVKPTSKEEIEDRTAILPPFLFAHNHQQRAMETGWADNLSAGGWAGRLADLWSAHTVSGVNGPSSLGMNTSFGGATRMMTGRFNSPTVLSRNLSTLFNGEGFDATTFKDMNQIEDQDGPLHRLLKRSNSQAATLSDILANELTGITNFSNLKDPYGNDLFSKPSPEQTGLSALRGTTLSAAQSAARMILLGKQLGMKRQIVFIDMGGFDNHSALTTRHPLLLRELSLVLWSFQQAMDSVEGLSEKVTLCTLSDFGRSLGNNGDGTDHAWAGHNLVVGGDVNGGKMVGRMPDMKVGGDNDWRNKGRMIPDISVDQYLATLCDWFGLKDEVAMGQLFPNLKNFKAPGGDLSSAYLQELMGASGVGVENPLTGLA